MCIAHMNTVYSHMSRKYLEIPFCKDILKRFQAIRMGQNAYMSLPVLCVDLHLLIRQGLFVFFLVRKVQKSDCYISVFKCIYSDLTSWTGLIFCQSQPPKEWQEDINWVKIYISLYSHSPLKNEIDISQMYWYFFVVPIFIFYHTFKFLTFFKPKYM